MFGLDLVTVGSLFILASNSIQCTVREAPQIVINPVTHDILYNFDYSSAQLNRVQSDTKSPYAPEIDATTGGFRYDSPKIETSIRWKIMEYSHSGATCMWYDTIAVDITMQPQIFISRDYKSKTCRDAILRHEEKHVQVDRVVMNRHARKLGQALRKTVRDVGALGPFNKKNLEKMQKVMVTHVEKTIKTQEALLAKSMEKEQARIDSLHEYETISKICNMAERKAAGYRQNNDER